MAGTGVLVGTIVSASDNEDALLGVAINGTVAQLTGKNTLPKNSPIIFEGPSANAKAVLAGFGAVPGTQCSRNHVLCSRWRDYKGCNRPR